MAINIKELLANALLDLCESTSLKSITIKDLLNHTGVSRQTFYNHFKDKNDLIQYIYVSKIIPCYHDSKVEIDFYTSLLDSFNRMKKYRIFLKQACLLEGQNCLKDYIFEHCKQFDLDWHQHLYGKNPMPDTLRFATEYHSLASSSMTLSWILFDFPISCEEMADLITELRSVGMDQLFADGDYIKNPYAKLDI